MSQEKPIRYFQFLQGERQGEVVVMDGVVEDDGMIFVKFKDGSRCNEKLIAKLNSPHADNMLMAEVSDAKNLWRVEEKWVGRQEEKWAEDANGQRQCVQPFNPGRKVVNLIPPRPVSEFERTYSPPPQPEAQPERVAAPTPAPLEEKFKDDPVWVMLQKSKKFETEISLDLVIDLPKKSLYNIIDESFDNGGSKMVEFIIETMDVSILKGALKDSLLAAYSSNDDVKKETKDPIYEQPKVPVDPTFTFEPEVIEEPEIGPPVSTGKKSVKDLEGPTVGMEKFEDQ